MANQNISELYLHCPQNTTMYEIHGDAFLQVNSGCVVKTDNLILKNYQNSIKNMTFKFMQEGNVSFDLRQISDLKKEMVTNDKQNFSEDPLSLNLKNLKMQMDHFQFKKRMLTFHHNSMFIVVPVIFTCSHLDQ